MNSLEISAILAAFLAGYMLGTIKREDKLWKLCKDQQKRGDDWFDKYQSEIDPEWKPLNDD
jgi:hypothetical protein